MTISTMLTQLWGAFGTSVAIFALTLLGSLPLGLLVALGRRSRFKPLRWLITIYISIMRGTPLMLQLIVVYFGPSLLFGARVPGNWRFISAITAFVINYAAYFAEIYRGGIESIPQGQYEAAQVLGYTKGQTFFHIILPQLAPVTVSVIIMTGIGAWNEFITATVMVNGYALKNIQMAIYDYIGFFGQEWGPLCGAATLAIIPILLVFTFLGKQLVSGLTAGAVKG